MAAYSWVDRLLHRLALGVRPIAELSFDIDQKLAGRAHESMRTGRHVFVSGLARAGTTMLMREFHRTGRFRSLTYRDMPFVLAPNLWRRLSGFSRKAIAEAERAHGDTILVDADSPEALEEPFWRIFAGAEYIRPGCLRPHDPDDEIVSRYVAYVGAVLASGDRPGLRYLSKNNNNLLRLSAIRRAFPNALILIPFRSPEAQARSLAAQHRRFCALHSTDRFARAYMGWLVHHEFGLDARPFAFGDDEAVRLPPPGEDAYDAFVEIWCRTYEWLAQSAPEKAVFVCYEDLCQDPAVWRELLRKANVPAELDGANPFWLKPGEPRRSESSGKSQKARRIYEQLAEASRYDTR